MFPCTTQSLKGQNKRGQARKEPYHLEDEISGEAQTLSVTRERSPIVRLDSSARASAEILPLWPAVIAVSTGFVELCVRETGKTLPDAIAGVREEPWPSAATTPRRRAARRLLHANGIPAERCYTVNTAAAGGNASLLAG